jgi:murein DD-endopeptidase MepM/ murein hydrolase activator NlpD
MARRMPRLRLVIVVAAVPLLLWGILPVLSQGQGLQGRIEKKRAQIDAKRGRERVLTTDITSLSRQIGALQSDITTLQTRQVRLEADLAAKRAELARIQERLRQERIRLARLRARLAESRTVLAARLVALYKAGEPDIVTVILKSDGFAQMLESTEFIQRIGEQDKRIIDAVRAAKAESAATAKRLDALEARQQRVTDAVAARRDEVVAVKTRLVSRREQYAAVREAGRRVLSHVRADREELEGDLQVLEAEQARIRARLAAAAAASAASQAPTTTSVPVRSGSSGLIWPVNGPIVSGFGMRWGRLHAGVDIAVPAGTPIAAAASGTVVLMGWVDGYGNYTCVDHGGGLSTCYGHQSGFATSQGATVSQGQVIGYVGCTGHCFGDHLHFETRVNGVPVDPMGYL